MDAYDIFQLVFTILAGLFLVALIIYGIYKLIVNREDIAETLKIQGTPKQKRNQIFYLLFCAAYWGIIVVGCIDFIDRVKYEYTSLTAAALSLLFLFIMFKIYIAGKRNRERETLIEDQKRENAYLKESLDSCRESRAEYFNKYMELLKEVEARNETDAS